MQEVEEGAYPVHSVLLLKSVLTPAHTLWGGAIQAKVPVFKSGNPFRHSSPVSAPDAR